MTSTKPTRDELRAAYGRTVPDLIAEDLRALFVGINPSLYSACVGVHFARPGNRFWPTLFRAGITARQLLPAEQDELLACGYGITNVVDRATASADELSADELVRGARSLARKVRRWRPAVVALLGVGAYRTAFARPRAALGPQDETLAGARIWVLPNPSGLNAHYQIDALARLYAELHAATRRI